MKLAIFDLDDTLFDSTGQLAGSDEIDDIKLISPFTDVFSTLKDLKDKKIKTALVTYGYENVQNEKVKALKVSEYFDDIIICKEPDKKFDAFKDLAKKYPIDGTKNIFIIGDRIDREIMFGNMLGMVTIRYDFGKYKNLKPEIDTQIPHYTINSLMEISKIL